MKRHPQVLVLAFLASGLACEMEGQKAGGAGGRADGAAGGGTAPSKSAGSGGSSSAGSKALSGGFSAPSSETAGRTSSSAGSTGGSQDSSGGSSSSAVGGGTGGASGQAGAGGSSRGAGTGGRTGVAGTTGAGGASATAGAGGASATAGTGGASTTGGGTAGTSAGSSGTGSTASSKCTTCHGDSATGDPSPPSDTQGNAETSSPGVGAHSKHLAASAWHRQGKCVDCHTPPTSVAHANDKVDFTWGAPSNADNAKPSFDTTSLTCTGSYCHGSTLPGASSGKTAPVWNQVNGSWSACGTTCHATPPAPSTGHPDSAACEKCHSKVIASFEGTSPQTTWKDASLHINGTVDVDTLTCTTCHGSANSPAPPKDTQGGTATTAAGVGAHAQHLGAATWHRQGQCADCHKTPTSMAHANNTVDFTWGAPSTASSATPSFNAADLSCSGAYCHGAKMTDKSASIGHVPVWNKVDGTHDACGKACHANPPASGSHTASSTACQTCHGDVIASYDGANSTWKNAALHINGKVEAAAMTCTSCHGTGNNPAPPKDTQGGTATTAAGVGAHAQHLGAATWHRQGQCADCHKTPTSMAHANNSVDFSWGAPSNASSATPSFNGADLSCSGAYCHGAKMTDKSASIGHVPVWNKVDGTHDACGKACHANPPAGGSHTATSTACQSCHGDVIASYNGASSTWKNAALHINGKVEATAGACDSCHGNPPTTGTHRRREHQVACTNCHPNPSGTTHRNGRTDQSCGSNNAGCHEND